MASSSLIRDWTQVPYTGSRESQPLDNQGSPSILFLICCLDWSSVLKFPLQHVGTREMPLGCPGNQWAHMSGTSARAPGFLGLLYQRFRTMLLFMWQCQLRPCVHDPPSVCFFPFPSIQLSKGITVAPLEEAWGMCRCCSYLSWYGRVLTPKDQATPSMGFNLKIISGLRAEQGTFSVLLSFLSCLLVLSS